MAEETTPQEYQFTKDWFNWAPPLWKALKNSLPEGETYGSADYGIRNYLEIGSFEGRSAVWTMENMMRDGESITCIDTWEGGEEHSAEDMDASYQRYIDNMALAASRFPGRYYMTVKDISSNALAELKATEGATFDFVYIDGSHVAKDVLTDACMVWPMLNKGGIIVFDDYLWGAPRDILHRPKPAIDAFVNIFAEELDVLHMGYQVAIKKK